MALLHKNLRHPNIVRGVGLGLSVALSLGACGVGSAAKKPSGAATEAVPSATAAPSPAAPTQAENTLGKMVRIGMQSDPDVLKVQMALNKLGCPLIPGPKGNYAKGGPTETAIMRFKSNSSLGNPDVKKEPYDAVGPLTWAVITKAVEANVTNCSAPGDGSGAAAQPTSDNIRRFLTATPPPASPSSCPVPYLPGKC